jgi:hypothetical protein
LLSETDRALVDTGERECTPRRERAAAPEDRPTTRITVIDASPTVPLAERRPGSRRRNPGFLQ